MHYECVTRIIKCALAACSVASSRAIQIPLWQGGGNYNAYNTRHLTSSAYNYAIVNRQIFRRILTLLSYRDILCSNAVVWCVASRNIPVISCANFSVHCLVSARRASAKISMAQTAPTYSIRGKREIKLND